MDYDHIRTTLLRQNLGEVVFCDIVGGFCSRFLTKSCPFQKDGPVFNINWLDHEDVKHVLNLVVYPLIG